MGFITSLEVYNRIKSDSSILSYNVDVTYMDFMKRKFIDISFINFRPIDKGGDIPFHRIYYFKYKGKIFWDREKNIMI